MGFPPLLNVDGRPSGSEAKAARNHGVYHLSTYRAHSTNRAKARHMRRYNLDPICTARLWLGVEVRKQRYVPMYTHLCTEYEVRSPHFVYLLRDRPRSSPTRRPSPSRLDVGQRIHRQAPPNKAPAYGPLHHTPLPRSVVVADVSSATRHSPSNGPWRGVAHERHPANDAPVQRSVGSTSGETRRM